MPGGSLGVIESVYKVQIKNLVEIIVEYHTYKITYSNTYNILNGQEDRRDRYTESQQIETEKQIDIER